MLVLYRREKLAILELDSAEFEEEISDPEPINLAPPPGFENFPPPTELQDSVTPVVQPPADIIAPPPVFETPPAQVKASPMDILARPVESVSPALVTTPSPEINVPLDYSNSVFSRIVSQNGIEDSAAFLSFASNYDADGNGYLRQSELESAATEFLSSGQNLPLSSAQSFSDEQLLAGGWTQEQIDNARAAGEI